MHLIPYMNFNGNCAEAFDFYTRALDGDLVMRMTYREMPQEMWGDMPPESLDRVMHAQIEAGGAILMGADGPPRDDAPGAGACINVSVDSIEEAERVFVALAEGGEVRMPIAETFWAYRWGALVDRYGKPWMVNCMKPPQG